MIEQTAIEAIIAEKARFFPGDGGCFSETRDVFSARLQSYIQETRKYLEAAVIGEIGNNTFDHNFVFDPPYPRGVYCNIAYNQPYIVIADYGKGIWRSLSLAAPSLGSDAEAVETAFTKKISGRHPEQRGNGLKFVAKTIQKNNWHLFFQSGYGACSIDHAGPRFFESPGAVIGCLAVIHFNGG
jgi:hypothetical protein